MKSLLWFVLLLFALREVEAFETEPALSFAFPMQERDGRVVTTMPVLVSYENIIPAGAHLHCVYVTPGEQEPDANVLSFFEKDKRREATFTRKPQHVNKRSLTQDYVEKSLAMMRRQRWIKIQLFQLAFANLAHKPMRIVYSATGDLEPTESLVDLPNGLLVAERGGAVVVLAVQIGSRTQQAGIKAGDIIQSLNGVTLSSLTAFSKAWKGQSKSNDFSLVKAGRSIRTVTLRPPVSLNTSVFDVP